MCIITKSSIPQVTQSIINDINRHNALKKGDGFYLLNNKNALKDRILN